MEHFERVTIYALSNYIGQEIRDKILRARVVQITTVRVSKNGVRYFNVLLEDDIGRIVICFFENYTWIHEVLQLDEVYEFLGFCVQERYRASPFGAVHPAQLTSLKFGGTGFRRFPLERIRLHFNNNVLPIAHIYELTLNQVVDFVAICINVSDPILKYRNDDEGTPFLMRILTVLDHSGYIDVAIIGTNAEQYDQEAFLGKVIGVKAAKTSDFGTGGATSLKATELSRIYISPVCDRADELLEWSAGQAIQVR